MLIFQLIARGLAPLTLVASVAAFLYPPAFLVFKDYFLWFFAATMFAIGVVMEPEELVDTVKRPMRIGLGVLTQYTVMPLFGFAAAMVVMAAGLPKALALGFIIVGCAPGAMASNVIVYLAGGAVAYSVALTTVATFLSPLLTPALVEFFGSVLLPIPFWGIMKTILWVVLVPLIAGLGLRRVLGSSLTAAKQIAPAVAAVAIIIICAYAVAANQSRIASLGPLVFVLVVVLNALGYVAGGLLARLYRFDRQHRLTLAIEIGMQNAGLGVALALKHFESQTALPGALFAVWCILTAAGASAYFRRQHAVGAP
ncbi:MAG: bile acid:sodium symporter family protein [Gammaproteobacteria bacterium]|nr:bile acid:sodium symporter family protein [Gammaproteobacteria bacterium]